MTRNPFDEIERMFDRMGRQFQELEGEVLEGSVAVDLRETDDTYVATVDLPGFDREEIDVELAGDRLTISADHTDDTDDTDEESETGGRYIRRERRHRSVSRSVRIPGPVAESETEAEFHNGVLTVTLPKVDSDSGENIPIN